MNAQVTQADDGYLYVGKRTAFCGRAKNEDKWPYEIKDEFRGLPKYIFDDKRIRKFFAETKEKYILYGEWLVKHTVNYDPEFMNRFWIFDVYDKEEHRYLKYPEYEDMLVSENLDYIRVLLTITDPTMEILLRMVQDKKHTPKSDFGADCIEGLVYKNYDFINRFGNNVYMKAVTKDFYEIHRTVMGGAGKRIDPEVYLIHKYQTPGRMEKLRFDMGMLRKVSYAMSKNWFIDRLRQRGTDGDDKKESKEDTNTEGK